MTELVVPLNALAPDSDTMKVLQEVQMPLDQDEAVRRIHRCYQRYKSRRIFSFFSDLLSFHNKGTAALMLKSINPRESGFIEGLPGIHVRFRLGGTEFPPTILYRVFVHAGLCDVGSFAPRTYAGDEKQVKPVLVDGSNPKAVYNTVEQRGGDGGWYRRVEDNPWRPVSSGILSGLVENSNIDKKHWAGMLPDESYPSKPFHPNKLVRQQDIVAKRRRRQVDWMRARWKAGKNCVEYESEPEIDEEEAGDLLEWTSNLDYNSYADEWLTLGTTRMDLVTEIPKMDVEGLGDEFWEDFREMTEDI